MYCFCMGRNAGTYDFMQHGIGQKGLGLIRGDTVLDFLYDKNIFIRIFTGIFYGG